MKRGLVSIFSKSLTYSSLLWRLLQGKKKTEKWKENWDFKKKSFWYCILKDWQPFATRRQVMCHVIEFLSDLLNVLAVSLSRRHLHIFRNFHYECCAHTIVPRWRKTQLGAHTYAPPPNQWKSCLFLSATVRILLWWSLFKAVFDIWLSVFQLPSELFQGHRWKQASSSSFFFDSSKFCKLCSIKMFAQALGFKGRREATQWKEEGEKQQVLFNLLPVCRWRWCQGKKWLSAICICRRFVVPGSKQRQF